MSLESPNPIQTFALEDFTFRNGATLPNIRIAYQILNPRNTKVAVVHTCFRGRIANTLTHANGALRNHKVIVVALLGNGESSSPSNTPDFPQTLEYMDCVKAQHILLTQHLGIEKVDVMLGFSMGGQITYHWITSHPSYVKQAVIVCSSAKTSRHNIQFLEGPRVALESARDEQTGIRAFGKAYSAWLTSAEWFDQELFKSMGFETQDAWDDSASRTGYEGWSGADLVMMLGMWQRGDITRCLDGEGKSMEDALAVIETDVLLMPCETDQYFRPYVNVREQRSLRKGRVEIIPSIWGHIAGGGANEKDAKWMGQRIEELLLS